MVGSGSFSISCYPFLLSSVAYALQFLSVNDMSWWFVLYVLGHLINCIVSLLQSTSGLCFTNQSYLKNISMPFKFVTTASICSLYPLISTSSSANHVISPFFILSTLKTSSDLSIGSVLIFHSLTNCLLILVWVHPESTNTCNHSSFLFLFWC